MAKLKDEGCCRKELDRGNSGDMRQDRHGSPRLQGRMEQAVDLPSGQLGKWRSTRQEKSASHQHETHQVLGNCVRACLVMLDSL